MTTHTSFFDELKMQANAENSPALACIHGISLSYSELISQIVQTGVALTERGLGSPDRVALLMENGPLAASAFLSLSAHVAVAPLNPLMKAAEVRQSLESLEANALVVAYPPPVMAAGVAADLGIPVLVLHSEAVGKFEMAGPIIRKSLSQDTSDIAMFLHTSGTTGRPKLVPLTRANLLASARNVADSLSLTAEDRNVNIMPLFHIHGLVAGLMAPLLAGGTVLAAEGLQVDSFLRLASDFGASWYTGVPTMHQAILGAADRDPEAAARCRFRFIRASSSALPMTVRAGLERRFDTAVVEAYGMTEAAHQMTSQRPLGRKARGSVGAPNGVKVAVLDVSGNTLETGATGEVAIQGPNVMAGYNDNVSANAETFTNGWMRTGDIGQLDANGDLFLVGRIKEIIKRGGFQISPVEVEDALLSQSGITQAVAFGVPHETLGQDLVCAVVAHSDQIEATLRDALFEILSDYKVPSRILIVDNIPVGATGKLQRIGLDKAFHDLLFARHIPPNGPLEEMLADMIEEVLPECQLGATDGFFLSGGDSLSGVRLISRLRGTFGIDLPLGTLFRFPTIKRLADHLGRINDGQVLALIEETLAELDANL